MSYLIVGLGNIGAKYDNTRHNIGFEVVDLLAKRHDAQWEQDRLVLYTSFKYKGKQFHLIKPTTYMNLSGRAVKYWYDKLKIKPENLLVILDDLSLDFEKLRLRLKGSAGGHNGLKNIQELMGTAKYSRIKFGIGGNFPRGRQIDFVLGEFNKQEKEELPFLIDRCADMATAYCTIGAKLTWEQFS
ncbi:UNVERIFIED_CONTAM: hypothetical protein GTU68_043720 [Idotea baltica]|nr:hypothetical protein [Idotea baltica]